MPQRIQRRRTPGWRMPSGAGVSVGGHAYGGGRGVVEPRSLGGSNLHYLWRTSGSQAARRMHGEAPSTPVRRQARRQQRVSEAAPGRSSGVGRGVPRWTRRYGSQGGIQPAAPPRPARRTIRSPRHPHLRPMRLFGQAGPAVRPYKWGWGPSSPVAPLGQRLLLDAARDVAERVPSHFPSALCQLQRNQAPRTPGMAVASCR